MSFVESSRRRVHRTSNYSSEEYIGKMPTNVITNILNRLPIKEAVRTCTLARNWRFKWRLLTDVIVDDYFFYMLTTKFDGTDITGLLHNLIGPIRRFVFSIDPKTVCGIANLNYEEIGDWLLYLCNEGIEELTIRNWYGEPVSLPIEIYSRKELKHLELHHCKMGKIPYSDTFYIFPQLLRLELLYVNFISCSFWDFIGRCPLIEYLKVNIHTTKDMRLFELAKLTNINKLCLSFGVSNHPTTITTSNLLHLASLPKLQTLTLDFKDCNVRPI